ncbi:hypothetical protein Tco_0917642 [Tanacetum coccineum]
MSPIGLAPKTGLLALNSRNSRNHKRRLKPIIPTARHTTSMMKPVEGEGTDVIVDNVSLKRMRTKNDAIAKPPDPP